MYQLNCFVNSIKAFPNVIVFALALDDLETFEDVDDVIDPTSLDS